MKSLAKERFIEVSKHVLDNWTKKELVL
jgi:hypothetical protein